MKGLFTLGFIALIIAGLELLHSGLGLIAIGFLGLGAMAMDDEDSKKKGKD